MTEKDLVDMRRHALLKAARSLVRLRHSLEADAELNELLPRIEAEFNAQVQTGTLPNVGDLVRKYIEGGEADA